MPVVVRINLFFFLLLLGTAIARAQVTAELVVADLSVEPGRRTTVVLKLNHDPGWHTYWLSPGIGEATSIEWNLPEDWVASAIDWPVPRKIYTQTGDVSGHGFDGEQYLPMDVIVSPTAPLGELVTLGATVKWLMCEYESCIPGGAALELEISISDKAPSKNAEVQAALDATPMPEAGEGFDVAATRDGDTMSLSVSGDATFSEPHFFSFDELVWHDVSQEFDVSDGQLTATLPIDDYYEGEIAALTGVLAFTDGDGDYRGLLINAPLTGGNGGAGSTGLATISIWQALLFALIGGVILNLMPCVLPILSMKALSLAQASGADAALVRREGIYYSAGVIVSFVALAGVLLMARSVLGGVGWGFHLQNPMVILSLALVMAAVGFNLLGVFEMGLGFGGVGQNLTAGHSAKASFFTGVLAVVVAAPCTAPFMAAAIGAALVQPVPVAMLIFATLGLGLAFPYWLVTNVPGARAWLPKPGAWMITLQQVLAFPMLATAIWLLWVLGGQRGSDAMTIGLIAVLLLGIAGWAFGRQQVHGTPRVRWLVTALTAILLISGLAAQIYKMDDSEAGRVSSRKALFEETPYSPDALNHALSSGMPVFAYFTADWCVTCKVNERVAIKTEATAALFQQQGVSVIVGDWTNQNPDITEILVRYERAGVPMYLYFAPGSSADEGQLLPQILTSGVIREALSQ